jgi:hypothetical protein
LLKERNEIMAAMAAQNKQLHSSIDKLSQVLIEKLQSGPLPSTAPPPPVEPMPPPKVAKKVEQEEEPVQRIPRIKLPLDVRNWRNAHVLAWLAFRMELPQYMDSFSQASVDGLVLTKHVSAETLRTALDVTDELHVQKLLEGIRQLQDRQVKIDDESELERLQRFRRKKEEEDYAKRVLEERKKERIEQARRNKKRNERLTSTGGGEFRNVVVRTKIERDIRAAKTVQSSRAAKEAEKAATWRFEYTGTAAQEARAINSQDLYSAEEAVPSGAKGTSSYQRNIDLTLLDPTAEFLSVKPRVELKEVPASCSSGKSLID